MLVSQHLYITTLWSNVQSPPLPWTPRTYSTLSSAVEHGRRFATDFTLDVQYATRSKPIARVQRDTYCLLCVNQEEHGRFYVFVFRLSCSDQLSPKWHQDSPPIPLALTGETCFRAEHAGRLSTYTHFASLLLKDDAGLATASVKVAPSVRA